MAERRMFRKKKDVFVIAVQIDLDTEGFSYQKWGGTQVCRRGDWLVDNGGDVYTVSEDSFARTYEKISPGVYYKRAPVWAEPASHEGVLETKEGTTEYETGDYIVSNTEDGTDAYAVSRQKFESMYEPVEDGDG